MSLRCTAVAAMASLLAGCLSTCGDNSFPAVDGSVDDGGRPGDGGGTTDAVVPLTAVDFAVGGCADTTAGCAGPAPLRLQFTPISTAAIDVYLWSFGDGAVSGQAAPIHVYREPGTYTVSLDVQGAGGAIGTTKDDHVSVAPGALAAPCERDEQCASGLCVCGEGDGDCPPGLAGRGFCSADCGAAPCDEGACVDLAPADPATPEDWQRELCLPDCSATPCGAGLTCRSLRDGAGDGWASACFVAGVLGDVGEPCFDSTGAPDNDRCTSGQCLDEGARGLCGFDCSSDECPADTECASFAGSLGDQCLRICDAGFECDADPWLACEPPGGAGARGFTVPGGAAPGGYCAPATCDAPADCGTEGQCTMGFCGP